MKESLNRWRSQWRDELDAARLENNDARERVFKAIKQAKEDDVTLSISRAALERISSIG